MAVTAELWCVALLIAVAALAVIPAVRASSHIVYGAMLAVTVIGFIVAAFAMAAPASATVLPLGLPFIGARFRVDALSAFFLLVVDFGAAAACLYGIGYGRHEHEPQRVVPFFAAFLAGMNLVLLADDAFTFLVAWEFMSLASWALVMAHHREPGNARAAFVYIVMASFGTLSLLLGFGLLAGPDGLYAFADMRSRGDTPMVAGARSRAGAARRRIEGRTGAAPRLAAARASGGAEPRLGADERRHDQGRDLRLRAHRVRPRWTAGLVVGGAGAHHRRHHGGDRRAARADAARSQARARLQHDRECRPRLRRPRARARLRVERLSGRGGAGADRGAVPCVQPRAVQEPAVLRRGRGAHRDRRAQHGAARRPHPPHAGDEPRRPRRLRRDFRPAAAQRLRLRMARLPGDPVEPAASAMGTEAARPRDRRAARARRSARGGLLRAHLSGSCFSGGRATRPRQMRARSTAGRSPRCAFSRCCACSSASCPAR